MELYIVRHGETDWNRAHRVQGSVDIELNEYGLYLAEETKKGLKNTKFDLAYSSPLVRAKKTAEVILDDKNVELRKEEALREISFGEYEGMCIGGELRDPKSDEFNKFFKDTKHYVVPKSGETVEHLLERTGEFLKTLYSNPELQDKRILLATHGAAMTALVNNIKGNLEKADFWKEGVPPNCAITIVRVEDGTAMIVKENLILHHEPVRSWKVGK